MPYMSTWYSHCSAPKLTAQSLQCNSAGFLSPASRGALLTALLVMYLLLAVAAGFSSVWLWGIIHRSYEGWYAVAWRVACYFPGISLLLLSVLNVLIHHTGSSGAIPLGAFFSLVSLWFLISIPLCFSGQSWKGSYTCILISESIKHGPFTPAVILGYCVLLRPVANPVDVFQCCSASSLQRVLCLQVQPLFMKPLCSMGHAASSCLLLVVQVA